MATIPPKPQGKLKAPANGVASNQSIYITNLNDKLQKHDLKRNLYMLFSAYGSILDITVLKTMKMRGQAHILFRDVQSATLAMRGCQGFDFFGKEMKITYAKSRSKTLIKLTGEFHDPNEQAQVKQGAAQQPSGLPAPPGTTTSSTLLAPPAGLPRPPGMSNGPPAQALQPPPGAENAASPAISAGTKRPRDESDDEGEGEAPMEEGDSDEGGEMEMSDDDD